MVWNLLFIAGMFILGRVCTDQTAPQTDLLSGLLILLFFFLLPYAVIWLRLSADFLRSNQTEWHPGKLTTRLVGTIPPANLIWMALLMEMVSLLGCLILMIWCSQRQVMTAAGTVIAVYFIPLACIFWARRKTKTSSIYKDLSSIDRGK